MHPVTSDPDMSFTDDVATFGDRLENAREAKGLSVEEFAEKMGIMPEVISAWENNMKLPRANRMQMLSGVLDVSLIWLMNGEDNSTADVAEKLDRPEGVADTLNEIGQVRSSLHHVLDRLDALEERLLNLE